MRHDLLAQCPEIGGITEHLAHLDGKESHQVGEYGGIAQQQMLKLGQAVAAMLMLGTSQSAMQRSARIAAEIVMIMAEDRFEQQVELQLVPRPEMFFHQRGIHTRTRLSNLSTSSGLAR